MSGPLCMDRESAALPTRATLSVSEVHCGAAGVGCCLVDAVAWSTTAACGSGAALWLNASVDPGRAARLRPLPVCRAHPAM